LAPLWAQWKALGDELKGHTLAESSILHDRARALNEAEALRRADAVANAVIDVFTNTQLGLTQEQQNLALSIVRLTFASGEVRTQNS
jgi:hypothetical protein